MTLFRWHRAGLEESMQTVINVDSLSDLEEIVYQNYKSIYRDMDFHVELTMNPYGFDPRINWDTHIVLARIPEALSHSLSEPHPVGFTNGPLPVSAFQYFEAPHKYECDYFKMTGCPEASYLHYFKKGDDVPNWLVRTRPDTVFSVKFGADVFVETTDGRMHIKPVREHSPGECTIRMFPKYPSMSDLEIIDFAYHDKHPVTIYGAGATEQVPQEIPDAVIPKIQHAAMTQRDLRMEEYLPQCSLCHTNLTKKERDAGMANCDSCQAEVDARAKMQQQIDIIHRANKRIGK